MQLAQLMEQARQGLNTRAAGVQGGWNIPARVGAGLASVPLELGQIPAAYAQGKLNTWAAPGYVNQLNSIRSAQALSELMGTRPGAFGVPQVQSMTGVTQPIPTTPSGLAPDTMLTPGERYQNAQTEGLKQRTRLLGQMPPIDLSKFRIRGADMDAATGGIKYHFTDEPLVRPPGQGEGQPRPILRGNAGQDQGAAAGGGRRLGGGAAGTGEPAPG